MTVLTLEELRNEMESGTSPDNVFLYKDKKYYICHVFNENPKDDTYHFGILNTVDTDKEFKSFDEMINAVLIEDKPFKQMLDYVKWY